MTPCKNTHDLIFPFFVSLFILDKLTAEFDNPIDDEAFGNSNNFNILLKYHTDRIYSDSF